MIDELDTWRTDEIVCPYCGYVFDESYEYIGDELVECPDCMKKFELESEEIVEYTTTKPDWLRRWRSYNNEQIYRSEWRIQHAERTAEVRFDE